VEERKQNVVCVDQDRRACVDICCPATPMLAHWGIPHFSLGVTQHALHVRRQRWSVHEFFQGSRHDTDDVSRRLLAARIAGG
jgi:hypothetical protein